MRVACIFLWSFLILDSYNGIFLSTRVEASSTSPSISSVPLLLRIRQKDGSIRRMLISSPPETTPLSKILLPEENNLKVVDSKSSKELDLSKTLTELNLARNGTLVNLHDSSTDTKKQKTSASKVSNTKSRFDPYPDLAKHTSYSRAKALLNAKGSSRRSTSFADMEKLQSSMHKIEPQSKTNSIKRLYMDQNAAERFQSSCFVKKGGKKKGTTTVQNKVGLLLGTVHKERVQQDRKVRTSLSSTTESAKMCTVVKVHAIWDPEIGMKTSKTNNNGKYYNAKSLHKCMNLRSVEIASELGLQPVGWIYTFTDPSATREEAQIPVLTKDVWNAGKIQAHLMENPQLGREEGEKFVTLAMDATIGATEGFQLCDIVVQMVTEQILLGKEGRFSFDDASDDEMNKDERYFHSRDPVIVDGQETHEVDSVLCLVNTAMLSHKGNHSGKDNVLSKSGGLTGKAKKRILNALIDSDSEKVFKVLGDFHILCGLDKVLGKTDMQEIIRLVKKYAKGQKKGTVLTQHLKNILQNVLNT